MAIGIVSDNDFLKELSNVTGSSTSTRVNDSVVGSVPVIVEIPKRGRKDGDIAVPDSIRQIIGETSVLEGRESALTLGKDFGISASSVSAYAKGATSTASYNDPKPSIKDHIEKSRKRAIKRASHVLTSALGAITQEKLDYTDAKDLSGIAKDMAVVIKNLEPPKENTGTESGSKAPQFIIFAPSFRKEESFDVIQTNE